MTPSEQLQNEDLAEEISAINAIYEPDTLTVSTTAAPTPSSAIQTTTKLQLPKHDLSFVIGFEASYPDTPPRILGTASTGAKGEGKVAVDVLGDIIARTYQTGGVCLFEVINEAVEVFNELNLGGGTGKETEPEKDPESESQLQPQPERIENLAKQSLRETFAIDQPPQWILSEPVTEKKSAFLGRVVPVSSLEQAQGYLDYLLATEKKVAAATHNISAWRIRIRQRAGPDRENEKETTVQDCDDDGETAAGSRLLHLMQLMDVWDVLVVVSRWYGGIKLGPDRFRLINAVGKDALIKGGYTKEGGDGEKGKKKRR